MTEQEQRDLVVKEAYSWIGTPYRHQAMLKGVGVDCALILLAVFREAGLIKDIEMPDYHVQWHLHRGEEKYNKLISQYLKPTTDPKPGDVGLFRFGRLVSHSVIVVDYPLVIHSAAESGVILDNANDGSFRDRLYGFYTFWGK